MLPTHQGSFRLFRFAGIDVFLHWSWFVVAIFVVQYRMEVYSSVWWNGLEYLLLFAIVLLHEFGHSLACRSVGGQADRIILWPFGGVAYVSPPPRPGPTLWSIAAGPLVNVVLFPFLTVAWWLSESVGLNGSHANLHQLVVAAWGINLLLLIFNLLPVYPLDGGQILRSLLWFGLGRARSLLVTTIIGFVGVAGLIGLAWRKENFWLVALGVFIAMNCWRGFQHARMLGRLESLPKREGFACPECRAAPPLAPVWVCGRCRGAFDIFRNQGACPQCGTLFEVAVCLNCGGTQPLSKWVASPPVPTGAA